MNDWKVEIHATGNRSFEVWVYENGFWELHTTTVRLETAQKYRDLVLKDFNKEV